MNVLALVTARGGSRGLPRKNVLPLQGKPLIVWTIEAALRSRVVVECVVSTDDEEIAAVSRAAGALVPFVRPAHLANDAASSLDVALHAVEWAIQEERTYDTLLLLQPTSPLRTADDIDGALALFAASGAKSCVSVCETGHSPYWTFSMNEKNRLRRLLQTENNAVRRQDLPVAYHVNGAVYIADIDWMKTKKTLIAEESVGYVMPRERSVDIDSRIDFMLAEALLSQNG